MPRGEGFNEEKRSVSHFQEGEREVEVPSLLTESKGGREVSFCLLTFLLL